MTIGTTYGRNPVAFFDAFIRRNELNQPFKLFPHQREIMRLAFAFDQEGCLPWDTIIWSCPKKSGKTTINGGLTTWWSYTQEAPNECLILANDGEQAASRVFRSVTWIIRSNEELSSSARLETTKITLSNGSLLPWLTCDYSGVAGSNHGLTSWDELWGYVSEGSRRLWEELTPVPTRRNSIRLISTYSGFENESKLLRELYLLGVGPDEHPDGQGERLHSTLPIYGNRAARIFCYWDHEPRMPWQTPRYYETQRQNLRPNTYLRLHENRWTVSESRFLMPELWDACVSPDLRPILPTRDISLMLGVDGSIKHDYAAVVGVARIDHRVQLILHRVWKPSAAEPLDLEATIEAFLREVCDQYRVVRILCDPYQLHRSITTLKEAGLPIEEFPQTTGNTTKMGTGLYDLIKGRNIRMYPNEELREQALNCVAVETAQGFRLAKEKASKKIDAIVALSMACVAALDQPMLPPFVMSCAGIRLGGATPVATAPPSASAPPRPRGKELLLVPKIALKYLEVEELAERARLQVEAARHDTAFEQKVRRQHCVFPGE
jgi:phage terminase large subunit-like protein